MQLSEKVIHNLEEKKDNIFKSSLISLNKWVASDVEC